MKLGWSNYLFYLSKHRTGSGTQKDCCLTSRQASQPGSALREGQPEYG